MFHILICDDEPFVCKEIEQALIACGIEKQIDVKVESFASGEPDRLPVFSYYPALYPVYHVPLSIIIQKTACVYGAESGH